MRCGFDTIKARDIDRIGVQGIVDRLKKRVGDTMVYISVDIDVLDPAFTPGESAHTMLLLYALVAKGSHSNISHSWLTLKIATGTAEVGGWTTRELLSILDGLEGLSIIGGDVVEVAPIYDNSGETTVLAAAQVVHSLLTLMVQKPVG